MRASGDRRMTVVGTGRKRSQVGSLYMDCASTLEILFRDLSQIIRPHPKQADGVGISTELASFWTAKPI